jgi:hypothetical protein
LASNGIISGKSLFTEKIILFFKISYPDIPNLKKVANRLSLFTIPELTVINRWNLQSKKANVLYTIEKKFTFLIDSAPRKSPNYGHSKKDMGNY